jgi:hypothetical protein
LGQTSAPVGTCAGFGSASADPTEARTQWDVSPLIRGWTYLSPRRPSAINRGLNGLRTVSELTHRVWKVRVAVDFTTGVGHTSGLDRLRVKPRRPVDRSQFAASTCTVSAQSSSTLCLHRVESGCPDVKLGREAVSLRVRSAENTDPDAGGRRSGGTRPLRKGRGLCLTSGTVFPGEDARPGIHFPAST